MVDAWGDNFMNTQLTSRFRISFKEMMVWGLAEVTLNLTGLDQLAAYSEFLNTHHLSAHAVGSEIVQILTVSQQPTPMLDGQLCGC
jgi:hypothetical protein